MTSPTGTNPFAVMVHSGSEVASATTDALRHLDLINIVRSGICISFTFILLEIISTLPDEIVLVWPARISPMKVLYLVNKYSPCVDMTIVTNLAFYTSDTQSCTEVYRTAVYAVLFGTLVSELILLGRTWAIWRFNRWILTISILKLVSALPFAIYTIEWALATHRYIPQDVLRVVGCMPVLHDQGMWPAFACIIFGETGIIVMTLIRMWYDSQDTDGVSNGTLHHTVYWDAIVFFLVILAFSVVNLIVMIVAPPQLGPLFHLPLRTVHSALCTRVLINLRKAAARTSNPSLNKFTMDTTLAFRSADGTSLSSPGAGELEHYSRHLNRRCSLQESVCMTDWGSALELDAGSRRT